MKAADLERARELLAEIYLATRIGVKLTKGERLRLTVGRGGDEAEIVLSEAFADELRTRFLNELAQRRGRARTALADIGVEL